MESKEAQYEQRQRKMEAARLDCPTCEKIGDGMGPTHDGSPHCESGSIASGGTKAHCTCDWCF